MAISHSTSPGEIDYKESGCAFEGLEQKLGIKEFNCSCIFFMFGLCAEFNNILDWMKQQNVKEPITRLCIVQITKVVLFALG